MSNPGPALLAELAPLAPVYYCPSLVAHQAPDVFELWRRWEADCGHQCPVPYWAVVWPGAALLARYLLDNPAVVAGEAVLDLGCGGGVAGLAARRSGARAVIANDVDPVALHVAQLNAAANRLTLEGSAADLLDGDPPAADVVLVAEMFYEKSQAERMRGFLLRATDRGATVLVADAERPFAPRAGMELLARATIPVNRDLEGVASRDVRLLRWRREPDGGCARSNPPGLP
jgi:predicted nicotinamide N-methyase